MKSRYNELQLCLAAVRSRVREGREALAEGNDVNLDDLGDQVRRACDAIKAEFEHSESSQKDRLIFAQQLEGIITDLDNLNTDFANHHAGKSAMKVPNKSRPD